MRFLLLFIICYIYFPLSAFANDYPFIPLDNNQQLIYFDEKKYDFEEKHKDSFLYPYYNEYEDTIEIADRVNNNASDSLQHRVYYNSISDVYNNYQVKSLPVFFMDAVGYYSVSVNSGISGAVGGGLAAGFSVGLDRYLKTGILDLGSTTRAASLMAASAYAGSNIGLYMANTATMAISGGEMFASAIGSVTGGAAAGVLFAGGAFFTGAVDRHEMRIIAAKSAIGSSASTGITAILGASAPAGSFVFPYAVALGTVYLVDKTFEAFDKQEEKEKIEHILLKVTN